jgi:hypothetical protein
MDNVGSSASHNPVAGIALFFCFLASILETLIMLTQTVFSTMLLHPYLDVISLEIPVPQSSGLVRKG